MVWNFVFSAYMMHAGLIVISSVIAVIAYLVRKVVIIALVSTDTERCWTGSWVYFSSCSTSAILRASTSHQTGRFHFWTIHSTGWAMMVCGSEFSSQYRAYQYIPNFPSFTPFSGDFAGISIQSAHNSWFLNVFLVYHSFLCPEPVSGYLLSICLLRLSYLW